MEILSYILNIILATGYISYRSGDIEKYHCALDKLTEWVKAISLDANSFLHYNDDEPEKEPLMRQITAELHHLVDACYTHNRNYENFEYDKIISRSLYQFRKEVTGAGEKSVAERIKDIDTYSVKLCQAINSCKITRKWRVAFLFWYKI